MFESGSKVRVFIASSLDGFISGPNDDLSWLPAPLEGEDFGYAAFMNEVGALLMGKRTYQVVAGFEGEWPYGDRAVLVASHQGVNPKVPTVQNVSGTIEDLVSQAKIAAKGKDVYLDGGNIIRQALDAGLVDEMVVTMIPVILGSGSPLFAGAKQRHSLQLIEHRVVGDVVQLRFGVKRGITK